MFNRGNQMESQNNIQGLAWQGQARHGKVLL